MMIKLVLSFVVAGCGAAPYAYANPITGLFNTGVDDSNSPLSYGANDTHYVITSGPHTPQSAQGVVIGSWPLSEFGGPYLANGAHSQWIRSADDDGALGNYTYQLTFTVNSLAILESLWIEGDWTTDNNGLDILINGKSTGNTTPFEGFGSLHHFSIGALDNQSSPNFQIGSNTLDFKFYEGGVVAGFRVDNLEGGGDTRIVQAVPEPSTYFGAAVLLAPVVGSAVRRLRRKQA